MTLELLSHSPEETERLGEALGRMLQGGEVLGIDGDLGAGKTCLVRGIARGLDIDPDVIYSPSFTLAAEHSGRVRLNHVDLFRLGEPVRVSEAEEIGLWEYLETDGVTAVEWYGKLAGARAASVAIEISIEAPDRRRVRLTAHGRRAEEILRALAKAFGGALQ